MSDRFDADLKKALKESMAQSLEGWEFTPAMRQAVLKRLEEEEAVAPQAPAPLRQAPARKTTYTRPAMWVAVAAAAFILAINMNKFSGVSNQEAEAPSESKTMAASGAAAPKAAKPGGAANELQSAAIPGGTGGSPESSTIANNAHDAGGAAAENAAPSTAEERATALAAPAEQPADSKAQIAAPASPPAPARLHLLVPGASPRAIQPMGKVTSLAAPPEMLAIARVGSNVAVSNREGLQFLDATGKEIWQQRLPEGRGPLLVANGKIATAAGSHFYLFSTEGKQEVRLALPGAPEALAVSPDGRVAAVVSNKLFVYAGSNLQIQADNADPTGLAFGPDGSLAALISGKLTLFGRDGSRLWQADLKGLGLGIAFAAGGDVIVAGGQAFNRAGQLLWEEPSFRVQSLTTLGPDGPVVLWEAGQTLTLRRPQDGAEIWTAEHGGRQTLGVATSDAADEMAILASVDDTAVVWVLDKGGGLRYSERLQAQPAGVALEGDTLFLLMPGGVETRAIPPR